MMWGEPEDQPGECNAHLYLADDYGDNSTTLRCGLPEGHKGQHLEKFKRSSSGEVKIWWERDEKEPVEELEKP